MPYASPAKLAHSGKGDNTTELGSDDTQSQRLSEAEIIQPAQLPRSGSPIHIQLSHLRSLADEDAEKVAEVLKGWSNE
jgi:flagellar biosynthesis/type III secretory pathway M-ring protein FliF/YscJ